VRVGLLGGTFDPVHLGHLIAARIAQEAVGLDEVLFVPAAQPRLKTRPPVASGAQRLEMVRLAVDPHDGFSVSDVEIRRAGPSYTVDTLEALAPGRKLFLLVGTDALNQLGSWHRRERVLKLCDPVAIVRPGAAGLDFDALEEVAVGASEAVRQVGGPLLDVSSTEVRRRAGDGLSIAGLVPEPVEQYIRDHGLYLEGGSVTIADSTAAGILELATEIGALRFGEFTLASGGTSSYYFDGRLVTLDPEGSYRVATAFYPVLVGCSAQAIAGPSVGADPIVASIATVSHLKGNPISALIVRAKAKEHGTGRLIEGRLTPGTRVAVVDDTCSTGGSLLHAIDAVEQAGSQVVKVLCILDRRQGGSDEVRRRGYDFFALLDADDEGNIAPAAP